MDTIETRDYQVIDLDYLPDTIYTLLNGNLAVTCRELKILRIYDSKFRFIKRIYKINNKSFNPEYLTSNGKDLIYVTDPCADKIIQTDLNFNFIKQFGSKGSSNQQLDKPTGLTFYENSVYVCDKKNKRIQKLSEDLIYQGSYPLNFKPWNIKIIKNIACIRSAGSAYISLYQLNPFSFKTLISKSNFEIYSINSWFYVCNNFDKKIECYDINGHLEQEKQLENLSEDGDKYFSLCSHDNRFMIGLRRALKILLL